MNREQRILNSILERLEQPAMATKPNPKLGGDQSSREAPELPTHEEKDAVWQNAGQPAANGTPPTESPAKKRRQLDPDVAARFKIDRIMVGLDDDTAEAVWTWFKKKYAPVVKP